MNDSKHMFGMIMRLSESWWTSRFWQKLCFRV